MRAVGLHDLAVALADFDDHERSQPASLLDRMRQGMLSARLDAAGQSRPAGT